jgi:hypothetical protein
MTAAADIAQALRAQIEPLCALLLPNGRREGAEWRCGSIHGEPGQSLAVRLYGTKAGIWKDFATDDAGDALDLVAAVLDLTIGAAMQWSRDWLDDAAHQMTPHATTRTRPPERAARLEIARQIWRGGNCSSGALRRSDPHVLGRAIGVADAAAATAGASAPGPATRGKRPI